MNTLIGNIVNSSALSHAIATTPHLYKTGVFALVKHPTDRRILATNIPFFAATADQTTTPPKVLEWNGEISLLPQLLQYDIVVTDMQTIENALLPAPSTLERQTLRIAAGDKITMTALKEQLVTLGFERDTTATRPRTFASRGDIMDIYHDQAYRISFFGDTIEHVSLFNAAEPESAAQKIDTAILIAPVESRGRSSLFDYIPTQRTILAYDCELPEPITADEARTIIRAEALAIPDAALGSDSVAQTKTALKKGIAKKPSAPTAANLPYHLTRAYHLRRDELLADIQSAQHTLILTHDPAAAQALITSGMTHSDQDARLSTPSSLPESVTILETEALGRGFILHAPDSTASDSKTASKTAPTSLLCLTDADLGLQEQREKKASKKLQKALMQQLTPGDYVVHAHHGVAKFAGMQQMDVDSTTREFFVLEYAGRDKIYVPVELADRLDKYIGEETPALHTLGTTTWQTTLLKVQEDAAKVAQELLDVYARRHVATAHHMLPQQEETRLDDACPYDLTPDQLDALQDIYADMQKDQPMDRLLCGDVGFGKTEVALRAAYRAILNGYQVAVLAPTTILAQQHYDTFTERFKDFGVSVGQLSRFESPFEQKVTIAGLADGSVNVVIGTHRLFSADVRFKKMGLIIIDEEQRFGVKAKETLTALRASSHVLTMTATPIPRTLHLSLAGVRAISTILTPPNARKPVELSIVPMNADVILGAVKRELEREGQVYYVYNRVQSIERRRMELQVLLGSDVRISVAHGQMNPKALGDVMHAFDTGQVDVLLATSIVENGLDIANANTMIVENAAMFGLAELYQLKGRVGRARAQGHAYFLYKERQLDGDVKQRFLALQSASGLGDGFELAMRDMEIRGVGNMLGKAQHGHTTKIGLSMYVRLLNTAVLSLQGEAPEVLREVDIDLPMESRIPEDVVPNVEERIVLYQRLAQMTEVSDLREAENMLSDYLSAWHGDALRPEIRGLLDVLEMKILASRSSLTAIHSEKPNDFNRLQSARITITADSPLPDLPPEWERVYERGNRAFKARTTLNELGATPDVSADKQWLEKIKHVIGLCSENQAT